MVEPLSHLRDRAGENWLIGCHTQQLIDLTESRLQALQQFQSKALPVVLLSEPEPLAFLAGFIAACSIQCPLFLGNPNWVEAEWQQVFSLVQPDLVWDSSKPEDFAERLRKHNVDQTERLSAKLQTLPFSPQPGWIMIPTGGSSGRIRFAIHTWNTLTASVTGFMQHFQVTQINSFCVLPLYHVSGLMQFMRSFVSGGKFITLPFKSIEMDKAVAAVFPADFFLSLVPTQLQRLLQSPTLTQWLAQFHTILLGGAPAWTDLLNTARQHRIRLAPTYGMTETAAQIATLKPEEFLHGYMGYGRTSPHAQITIRDQQGRSLPPHQIGTVTVQATSLALGYYPGRFQDAAFQTDDLGYFDADGYLHIVGRNSHKIITGGENVFPVEVETAIRATQLVSDVCVFGVPDTNWGETITAAYVPISPEVTIAVLQTALEPRLSKFKRPKHWMPLSQMPRNDQGKVNYEQLRQVLFQSVSIL